MQRDTRTIFQQRMHDFEFNGEDIDQRELPSEETNLGPSFETDIQEMPFREMEEMQLAAELLEITDEDELEEFISSLIKRAAGRVSRSASSPELLGALRQAAQSALPMIGRLAGNLIEPGTGRAVGDKLAAAAGNLFGLELEGLSPEDQEFETARRFVRFAGATARNASRFRRGVSSPRLVAQRALNAAAQRHAPGFLRRQRARIPIDAPVTPVWPNYQSVSPIPISVTCHCCGATQADTATTAGPSPADNNTLPDNEPANPTNPQSQTMKGTEMHDLDRTTLETSDEADFEFSEAQDEYGESPESPFTEEEVADLATELLEVNDEYELDQFLGSLLKKAKGVVGGVLKSPLMKPLGGLIKSGIMKTVLPVAGGALGTLIPVPGVGTALGAALGQAAGNMLEVDMEGMSPEDQAFEAAKGLVRVTGAAVQNAAQAPNSADPRAAAKSAVVAAAQAHMPGLLQPRAGTNGTYHQHHHRTGRWYRRGHKIILVGV
jgi:hypothetical protein